MSYSLVVNQKRRMSQIITIITEEPVFTIWSSCVSEVRGSTTTNIKKSNTHASLYMPSPTACFSALQAGLGVNCSSTTSCHYGKVKWLSNENLKRERKKEEKNKIKNPKPRISKDIKFFFPLFLFPLFLFFLFSLFCLITFFPLLVFTSVMKRFLQIVLVLSLSFQKVRSATFAPFLQFLFISQ